METDRPYEHGEHFYLDGDLGIPLPLPVRAKFPPPVGTIGYRAVEPTDHQRDLWRTTAAAGNLALRLAPGILAVDIDAYSGKVGARTLERAEAAWGALPATWVSTPRPLPNGHRFFRVPTGLSWRSYVPADLDEGSTGHIDLIHCYSRYSVVWPSLHPAGGRYQWLSPAAKVSAQPPRRADLCWLPEPWLNALTSKKPVTRTNPGQRSAWPPGGSRVTWAGRHDPARLRRLVRTVLLARTGQRNQALHTAAMHAAGAGLDKEVCREQLVMAATRRGLPPAESSATFESAWRYGSRR